MTRKVALTTMKPPGLKKMINIFRGADQRKRIRVSKETDIARVVFAVQVLAGEIGFSENEQFMIATASSELARNIFLYAKNGEVTTKLIESKDRKGIEIIAEDNGPGIKDIADALKDGFSTGGTLGIGLPGVKRLMDEFEFDSERRRGTKITVKKWLRK